MYSVFCSNKFYFNKLHVSVTLNNDIISDLAFDLEISESKSFFINIKIFM